MAERPERDADVQTIEHRRRGGYSASPSTMVKTLTRESTDGHRNGPILVGRTPGHIRWCSSDPPGNHPPSDIPHAGNWSNGCRRVSGPTRWISWRRDEQPRHNPSDMPAALNGMWIGARCGLSIQFAGPDDMQAVIPSPQFTAAMAAARSRCSPSSTGPRSTDPDLARRALTVGP